MSLGVAREPRRSRRLALWQRFVLASVLIVSLTAGAVATAGLLEIKGLADAFNSAKTPPLALGHGVIAVAPPGAPQTILILGSDRRFIDIKEHNPSRSDTILLVRLDAGAPATTVLSIPRDLKVRVRDPKLGLVTDKINSAYSRGGPRLTARTVKRLLHIQVNHIVNINFGGFRNAVNFLGCVYTDVDRRYYHVNDGSAAQNYASINVNAGYVRLCGKHALEYVRYRHGDTDIVRNARQQGFLRDIKDQVGAAKLVEDRNQLARIFGRYTQTDRGLHAFHQILRLLDLLVGSAGHPVEQVKLPVKLGQSYVTTNAGAIRRAVRQFLHPVTTAPRPAPTRRRRRHRRVKVSYAGLEDLSAQARQSADVLGRLPFPVYYPKLATSGSSYDTIDPPRRYVIRDEHGHRHRAYRLVISTGLVGQYYGVQGLNWRNPPILDEPSVTRRVGRRTLQLYYDGHHLRLVAWRTRHAVYWIANTLSEDVGNRQLLAVAGSLRRR